MNNQYTVHVVERKHGIDERGSYVLFERTLVESKYVNVVSVDVTTAGALSLLHVNRERSIIAPGMWHSVTTEEAAE